VPELPEVEVVRRGLQTYVVGRRVTGVEVLHPRPVRRHLAGPQDFEDALIGRQVTAAHRRGKYLWLALDDHDALLAHLGMSGQLLIQPRGSGDEVHLRVRIRLDDGHELRFVDQRMFGGLSLSPGGAVVPAEVQHIAYDPLDPAFNLAAVTEVIRRDDRCARPRRHLLRLAVRERERRERLLRALPGGLRARGGGVPPMRDGHRPGGVHEPLVLLLPALSAPASGRRATSASGLIGTRRATRPKH
jgi:hypothetical protein